MSRRLWVRIFWVAAICLLLLLSVRIHNALGQALRPGDDPISRGQSLTQAWCSQCHTARLIDASAHPNLVFEAIARMPSTTELSLRVFLQSNHRDMPNLIVKGRDLDDIVAYMLSLKQTGR